MHMRPLVSAVISATSSVSASTSSASEVSYTSQPIYDLSTLMYADPVNNNEHVHHHHHHHHRSEPQHAFHPFQTPPHNGGQQVFREQLFDPSLSARSVFLDRIMPQNLSTASGPDANMNSPHYWGDDESESNADRSSRQPPMIPTFTPHSHRMPYCPHHLHRSSPTEAPPPPHNRATIQVIHRGSSRPMMRVDLNAPMSSSDRSQIQLSFGGVIVKYLD